MSNSQPYVHQLSPFIFEIKNLSMQWMETGWGGGTVIGVLLALATLIFYLRTKPSYQPMPIWMHVLIALMGISFLTLLGLYGAWKQEWEWGLRWYSTMYVLGFAYGYFMLFRGIKKQTVLLTQEGLDTLIAFIIFGMILGARLAYVFIYNLGEYKDNLLDLFKVWEGGLSFHGGIVGVVTALYLFARRQDISFWHLADEVSVTVPVGIGLGRIGNFINGELYGRVMEGNVYPWAVIFPDSAGPYPRHPSQIYQSLAEGWLLLVTLIVIYRMPHRKLGTISVAFIGFYAFYRYFMEFFREADAQLRYYLGGTTTMGQILCGVTLLCALLLYFLVVKKQPSVSDPTWKSKLITFHT